MSKINPFSFARPLEQRETFTFVDPRYPDAPVKMTLRSPDIVDYNAIQDRANDFYNYYLDKPFPAVDGRIVTISKTLAESVAAIVVLQEGPEEELYTMEEVVAMTVTMPTIYADMSNAIASLTAKSDLGKLIGVRLSQGQSQDSNADTPTST